MAPTEMQNADLKLPYILHLDASGPLLFFFFFLYEYTNAYIYI